MPKSASLVQHDLWVCKLCQPEQTIDATQNERAFAGHLNAAHPDVYAIRTQIEGSTISHLDGDTWFEWNYRFRLPDGREVGAQSIRMTRAADDPFRFM